MTVDVHQRVIDELQAVLDDTRAIMESFEATGMDEQMPEDYNKLLAILEEAVTQQREHTLAMLNKIRQTGNPATFDVNQGNTPAKNL
ncbi:hypothetical protein DFP85_10439 [Halomonas ventosae]|uniref:Uncharacterized protein n=1 Tax=Halomonas ventosae TaxID=229007 RepID=A0A4R6ZV28_9GAMM|nr:hypothetical protein [Halomonas ventosae]TDR56124.1 hypothetical protein DFP85_10439 [Halomonas ventosae]